MSRNLAFGGQASCFRSGRELQDSRYALSYCPDWPMAPADTDFDFNMWQEATPSS